MLENHILAKSLPEALRHNAKICPSKLLTHELHRGLGAVELADGRIRVAVYCPQAESLSLVTDETSLKLQRTLAGYHVLATDRLTIGDAYWLELQSGQRVPDPFSRFQPNGPHGPSQIVRSDSVAPHGWSGLSRGQLVLYEAHIGTWTSEGTYQSAISRLDDLVELGVTAIEVMPVNQCGGNWNWGYDGVNWFAPMHSYGTPDDFRYLIAESHRRGLAVFLDVVYNHFGPDGNYLHALKSFVSDSHKTVWGDAPNFDQPPEADEIRRWAIASAIGWLDEYGLDGLRVDAIHCIADKSPRHWAADLSRAVREFERHSNRRITLIAEANVYDPEMLCPANDTLGGGHGFDAQWADDFVHAISEFVRPGESHCDREYLPSDLKQVLTKGFIYQGSIASYRQRENPLQRVDTDGLITCLQNHDFVGNHPDGKRWHHATSPANQRAAAAIMILSPTIPMIFMGEEFACESPFMFFVDFKDPQLRDAVNRGRESEYPQHDWSRSIKATDPLAKQRSVVASPNADGTKMNRWYQETIKRRNRWREQTLLSDANHFAAVDHATQTVAIGYRIHDRICGVVAALSRHTQESIQPANCDMDRLITFFTHASGGRVENPTVDLDSANDRFGSLGDSRALVIETSSQP